MKKIFFYEVFDEERKALKKAMGTSMPVEFFKETVQESRQESGVPDIVSIRTQSQIPEEWIGRLEGILTRSTGHDHVLKYIKQNISCGYLPSYCSRAVAEHAVFMAVALWKKIPLQIKQFYGFCRDGLTGREFRGKNILVVGVGKIGRECVQIARALGMQVKGADIDPREDDLDYVAFEEGLSWADAVIVAVPLTEQTKGMFDFPAFQRMKNNAVFVNVSRGEVSPLHGIQQALENSLLGGAALDVYDHEPEIAEALRKGAEAPATIMLQEMAKRHNVILTPHNAFNTEEAVEEKAQQSAETISHFLKTGAFIHEVPKSFTQEMQ